MKQKQIIENTCLTRCIFKKLSCVCSFSSVLFDSYLLLFSSNSDNEVIKVTFVLTQGSL